jgi:hypothetical protein
VALWRRRSRPVVVLVVCVAGVCGQRGGGSGVPPYAGWVALYGADAYGGRAGYAVVLATGGALVTTRRDIGTATG